MVLSKETQADAKLRLPAFSELKAYLSKPTASALEDYKSQPMLQPNPVLYWQGVALTLCVLWLTRLICRAKSPLK